MGLSNYLTGILNFLTLALAIPVIGAGIWLSQRHDTVCMRFLQGPVIAIGVFILVVSLAGFIGSCFRVSWLLWIYLFVMFLLIVLLLAFTIFAFAVTNRGAGHALSGKGYKEYRLGDYSTWLERRVKNTGNWNRIKSCLADAKVCRDLDNEYPTEAAFSAARLTPLESGCCKPPTACGFVYQNATSWINSASPAADTDCFAWNNAADRLCFDCNSCRAGVLENIRKDWRKVAIINIIVFVFLVVAYSVGCCAFRNARRDEYFSNKAPYR
ncbi:hypothetical protein SELMODRAFT_272321 [Selaginella moellendorffii]|uniref:Tetraspanin family protein n=1 Tax=Selaginella moellendorffii TaxID=88036 RepID=D8TCJ1_SELML|nr:tetraspanin-8 [Selaginella moellendorffii]EFJ05646.1 hypothetical protein SELMODRAFT_272321 [Selaginella moellendorffii]|eukprot:XP_002993321.1 tetraspanin-8 [Selaginella moellendorffii]